MMTKQEAIQLQVSLQEQIQKSGVNLIECSGCDAVVFHRTATLEEWKNGLHPEKVQCPHCDTVNFAEDCPDVYYDGIQNNKEFQGEEAIEIRVCAETSGYAEQVATFADDKLYNACLPIIKAWAKSNGFTSITESES